MSSGSLPLTSYYRASSIGEGAFGAVVVVYDDDGNEYALKQFVDEDSDDEEEEECEDSDDDSDYEDEDEDDEQEEEEDNDDEDEDDEEEDNRTVVNLGALREISILRILRGDNGHENIVPMIDVVQNSSYFESEEECGSLPYLSMTIPLYKSGSLADAIEQGSLANNRIGKVSIAFGLLNAVDYLHSNGIIHRDIKSDNILLEPMDTTSTTSTSSTAAAPKNNKKQNSKKKNQKNKNNKKNNNSNQEVVWKPILIDFSLAKVVNCSMYQGEYATKYPSDMMKELKQEDNNNDDDDILCRNFQNLILNDNDNPEELQRIQKLFPLPSSQKNNNNTPKKTPHKKGNKNNKNKNKKDKKSSSHENNNIQLHTDEVGTVTYIAPEVVDRKGYDLPCDLWSVGVVLLEMICPPNTFSQIQKNKHAFQFVEEKKQSLPNQPLPNLIRQLLITSPKERWTAQQALQNSDVFAKFGFINNKNKEQKNSIDRIIQMHKAFADPDDDEQNDDDEEGNDTKNHHEITESEREKENNNHAIHDNNNANFKTPQKNSTTTKSAKSTGGGGRRQRKGKASCYDNRYKIVQTICNRELHCQHPMTAISALEYAQELEQLEPRETLYDVKQSQHLLDCIVLAHRFWEKDVLDLDDLCDQDENEEYPTFHAAQWDLQHYIDSEDTLWMLMDYCLYPRNIIILNKE